MPVQQQMSSFAKKMGGRVAQANAEHADKPVDTGNRRLPPGIRDGIAKLSTMYTKEYEDDKNGLKGQTFFRYSAIVLSPKEHDGEKVEGMVTSGIISLCDTPAKGLRKATTFSENFFEFQNLFKLLGVAPCPETPATDPTGQRTEAYFFAAMKMLTDPVRIKTNPVYVSFSTRGWTPAATPLQPKPSEMVFETWHGLAEWKGQHDPAAGVADSSPPSSTPPQQQAIAQSPTGQMTGDQYDIAERVASLVEAAMGDPEGATEDGASASSELENLAWAAGWSKEQTASPPPPYSNDWAGVGDMALNPPTTATAAPATAIPTNTAPTVGVPALGSKWGFCKRTKDGEKLKDSKGESFPAQQVEVVSVDAAAKTCTLKFVKDGKEVVDIRTKKPISAKWEWLESV